MGKNNPETKAKYNKEHYESRNVRFKKEHNVMDRLKDASIICNKSVNSIIEEAVLEWLEHHELWFVRNRTIPSMYIIRRERAFEYERQASGR